MNTQQTNKKRLPSLSILISVLVCCSPAGDPVDAGTDSDAPDTPDQPTCVPGIWVPTSGSQRPIHIYFDAHSHEDWITEAVGGSADFERRRQVFQSQLDDLEWLLDTTDQYGARISFLSVGPWAELCTDDVSRDNRCYGLIRRLYDSGQMIGTHSHALQYLGSLNEWERVFKKVSMDDFRPRQDFYQQLVNTMIEGALGVKDPAAIARINLAFGTDSPRDVGERHTLIENLGYAMVEGGDEQEFVAYFNQVPYNPFRLGSGPLTEDLTGALFTVPQYPIFSNTNDTEMTNHRGVDMDISAARQKAMFLQLYVNWRHASSDKVWAYGWGSHVHDWEPRDTRNRSRLEEMLCWLSENFVSRCTPGGSGIARFSSYPHVLNEYEDWSSTNPSGSSFSYSLSYTDYDHYPYLPFVSMYLRNAILTGEISTSDGVRAFSMSSGGRSIVLAFSDLVSAKLDLSSTFGEATVRRVFLQTGDTDAVDPSNITLDNRSVLFCTPADCDAILADDTGTTLEGSTPGHCGDGQCGPAERSMGLCPEDCS